MAASSSPDLLTAALECLKRGWSVFPCKIKSKQPFTVKGVHDSTKDEKQIHLWWGQHSDLNPAINLGESNLAVLDIDSGLNNINDARRVADEFPKTLAVRTGRRPAWGLQLYFSGTCQNRPFDTSIAGLHVTGELRSTGYYVMAPGAIHDVSGEAYLVLRDVPLAPIPASLLALSRTKIAKPTKRMPEEKIRPSSRHYYFVARAIELYESGLYGNDLVIALRALNRLHCDPPKERRNELEDIAQWVEQNVQPGLWKEDAAIVSRLVTEDSQWRDAWEGNLSSFNGSFEEAYKYFANKLFEYPSIRTWAVERITKAAPLYRLAPKFEE